MIKSFGFVTSVAMLILGVGFAAPTYGAIGIVDTNVERSIVDSENFGGCMLLLEDMPSELNCGTSNWVSASCTGDFNSASFGWRKFEIGQMAQALNRRVRVFLDDSRKHNGKCFILRIDLLPN